MLNRKICEKCRAQREWCNGVVICPISKRRSIYLPPEDKCSYKLEQIISGCNDEEYKEKLDKIKCNYFCDIYRNYSSNSHTANILFGVNWDNGVVFCDENSCQSIHLKCKKECNDE